MLVELFGCLDRLQHRFATLDLVLEILVVRIDEGHTAFHLLFDVARVAFVFQLLLDGFDFEIRWLRQLLHALVRRLGQLNTFTHLRNERCILILIAWICAGWGFLWRRYIEKAAQIAQKFFVVDFALFPDLKDAQDFALNTFVAMERE